MINPADEVARKREQKSQRQLEQLEQIGRRHQLKDGGPPTDNAAMEARIKALEDAVKDLATKADLNEARLGLKGDLLTVENGLIKWVVGTGLGLGAAAITVMTFVLNNAAPKAPPPPTAQTTPSQQPPIIINVPGAAAPTTSP